ncbi:uncharacterized protein LOC131008488 [Salvia miltiorrhiza]|uniref:uncharacterized protein LOC131008488 n=1 Tax=Salvia miltiorrhiza TaxID=226208 RepID=UPI0025ACDF5F|nr:uncharacterized protein LOC131008488 [Salvia miltiorrhiza]
MNSLSWNCRGLGHPLAIPTLCGLVRAHKANFVFLCETISQKQKIEEIRNRLHFEGCLTVECRGRSGGLCMLWKVSSSCKVIGYSRNHIDIHVIDANGDWRLTGFYGYPERNRRRDSWDFLRRLAGISPLPWVVMGDFNDLLDPGEKRGRVEHPNWLFQGFRSAVIDGGISDIPLSGYQFTWSRGLGTENFVEERLDRAMANSDWKTLFPEATLVPLTAAMSDHVPILLKCKGLAVSNSFRRFRFENKWCLEPDLPNVVRDCWTNLAGVTVTNRLTAVSDSLTIWAKHIRRNEKLSKQHLQQLISELQGRRDSNSIWQLKKARSDLATMLLREEQHWKQRAKQHWLKDGDYNTKFFHAMASARRKTNSIIKLQRDDGSWTVGEEEVRTTTRSYFESLFDASSSHVNYHQVLSRLQPSIDEAMNESLTRPFQAEEFKNAVFQMHPDKAPGPDGFNPKFYQKFWSIIGDDVVDCCSAWLNRGSFPPNLNHTMISLIPKVDSPTTMKDLRPIALCNVLYKIISKVLCNRLKLALPYLIDRAQSAFVEGRLIQDNILIAFEAIHTMKRKTRGKFGNVALKIDISKAYDRVDWNYLDAILNRLGFCEQWRTWMRLCVSSVSYDVLVNGVAVGPILPGRGLRQGDPLSPYLFILCAEGLSAMIRYETDCGNLHGIQMGRGGPAVSHLMFADDCLFFCRATPAECGILKRVLSTYEAASGQAINYQKSGVFYSSNINDAGRDEISDVLGVATPLNTGRYLGLPSLVGRKKKEIFRYIRDRMWKKIQGWQGKKLSKAGKEILIKGVAQAIPSYCMSIFLLPTTLTDELERLMNSFWWSNKSESGRGINWMKWDRLCVDKKIGGLGFRSLQLLNLALLGKLGWRLIDEPDALVCRVLKAKYFPHGDFLSAPVGHSPSFTWRSICAAQDLVRRGVRWRIGDGNMVRVYGDPWLRNDDSFWISGGQFSAFSELRVSDLMVPGSHRWDVALVNSLFTHDDAHNILGIPLTPNVHQDKMVWHFEEKGRYTVKSAYKLASSLTLDTTYRVDGHWSKLWQIKIPPSIRRFIWRAARNNLPSNERLLSRGISVGGTCDTCKSNIENLWHTFFACPFAKDCWRHIGFMGHIDDITSRSESFTDALFLIIGDNNADRRAKVCMVMSQIWKDRNGVIWKGSTPTPARSITLAIDRWLDWILARRKLAYQEPPSPVINSCVGWHSLQSGAVLCNVDAAFFSESNNVGIGIAIRSSEGNFIVGKVMTFVGLPKIVEGELVGIKEALSWLKELGYLQGRVESDCMQACEAIASGERNISEMGSLAAFCREELSLMPGFQLQHVKRARNVIAHDLAKVSRDFCTHHVWNEPPMFVVGHLHLPCSCV